MNDKLKEEIDSRMKALPQEVVSIIREFHWENKIQEISNLYSLEEEQAKNLFVETAILVLGIESPQKFPTNVAENVHLSSDTLEKILNDIENQIYKPLLDKMKSASLSVPTPLATEGTNDPNIQNKPLNPASDTTPTVEESKIDKAKLADLPNYSSYESGKDPYREPIE